MAIYFTLVLALVSSSAHADNVVTSTASRLASGVKSIFYVSKHAPTTFRNMFIPYDALSPRQQELLATLQKARGMEALEPWEFWNELGRQKTNEGYMEYANSAQRTFFANTAALAHRYAKDGTPAIDLVEEVTDVNGGFMEGPSNKQYNIAVKWKKAPKGVKNMKAMFEDGRRKCKKTETNCTSWYNRPSVYHPGETGVQEELGGYSGLHLLFEKNSDEGHVTIAFRKTHLFESILTTLKLGFLVPKSMKEGHFSPQDADIGALGPEKKNGQMIDNLKMFSELYGYDYNTLLSYTAEATGENRSWTEEQIVYHDDLSAPVTVLASVVGNTRKVLPAESVGAGSRANTAEQAI